MIEGKVYSCAGCYEIIVFSEFSVDDSIYFEVGDFDRVHFFKPIKQSLVPYIIFDLPKGYDCSCLEVIFENKPRIHFAFPSDIEKWVLYRCNLCNNIEFDLSTLEHCLSSYLKNVLVVKNYCYSQNYKSKTDTIDLYYIREWISFLSLDVDFKIQQTELKRKLGWKI